MSAFHFSRRWADEEESDVVPEEVTRFESQVGEDGVKSIVEYTVRNDRTYKITRRVKQRNVQEWRSRQMDARRRLPKFGKAAEAGDAEEERGRARREEEVFIVPPKVKGDEAEDAFYEESLKVAEDLSKGKQVWADLLGSKLVQREEEAATSAEAAAAKPNTDSSAATATAKVEEQSAPRKYIPPCLRGLVQGKGVEAWQQQQQEATLRVTNLSLEVREGDLQDLFGQFGRLQRVYLAKDMTTYQSRGFAFITYHSREDAKRAMAKLNGHGYDNLILQVHFAKPRT
mmetsp:Transcript_78289/g.229430  ORF Transcript_78289/g.229430 Transcript_78289/m.229430 type:complete len:286 (+) Transcript_78289:59-916(+)